MSRGERQKITTDKFRENFDKIFGEQLDDISKELFNKPFAEIFNGVPKESKDD